MNLSCANRECAAELKYLRGGRLFLMERESRTPGGAMQHAGQEKKAVSMRRYFWLCENCAQQYVIRRWTEEGVELAPRQPSKPVRTYAAQSQNWMLPGMVG
jgi:hypothetical protein